jgi:hypothetical protein
VSTEQRENLDAILRQSAFPFDSDVSEQRRLLRELASTQPLPADVTVTAGRCTGQSRTAPIGASHRITDDWRAGAIE